MTHVLPHVFNHSVGRRARTRVAALAAMPAVAIAAGSCTGSNMRAADQAVAASVTVGVTRIGPKSLARDLTMSSELVPFQEMEVYAKVSGYARRINADYGSAVGAGDLLAVLEIPELEAQLQQDDAAVKNAADCRSATSW
jgi:multidrug efflux pump subunit AcrA (membrane-fusion protein)